MWRVLCVEDHADSSEMLKLWLERANPSLDVESTGNAASAMSMIYEWPFDLYLLDLWLPGISGDELCRWIRETGSQAPVIFFSGVVSNRSRRIALNAGADEFLVKPNDLERLPGVVERYLSRATMAACGGRGIS
jgi:DNA-binding response OmpR family regulator